MKFKLRMIAKDLLQMVAIVLVMGLVVSQVLALADQWLGSDPIVEERTWNEVR